MTAMTRPPAGPSYPPAPLRMTPARWVTLAIGVPIALVLILGGGLNLVSSIGVASFKVDRTIPLDHGRLVARTDGGDLTVRPGQAGGGAARLAGTVQYSLVRPDFAVNGAGISLHCRTLLGNCGLDARLSVPRGTALDLASGGGDLNASHLGGILTFTTSGGDVGGDSLTAPKVTVGAGGGDVSLAFTRVPATIDVTSSGGDVTIVLPHGAARYAVTVVTDGGDYQASPSVPVSQAAASKITVDSGGGDVSITEEA